MRLVRASASLAAGATLTLAGCGGSADTAVSSTTAVSTTSSSLPQADDYVGGWRPVDSFFGEERDSRYFLAISADGDLGGSIACNTLRGSYEIDEGSLVVVALFATEAECDDSESERINAFGTGVRSGEPSLNGDLLTFETRDGSLVLERMIPGG